MGGAVAGARVLCVKGAVVDHLDVLGRQLLHECVLDCLGSPGLVHRDIPPRVDTVIKSTAGGPRLFQLWSVAAEAATAAVDGGR